MTFSETMDVVARVIEGVGIAVLVIGIGYGFYRGVVDLARRRGGESGYVTVRRYVGRAILLGLEILIAADLIRTVTVEPTLTNVAVLGIIVVIRTFLSFSLEIEIDGMVPWRRAKAQRPREAASDAAQAPAERT